MIGLLIARLLAGRLAGWAVPAIVLELLVGFVLGNTLLPFPSIAPLSGLTELGVLTLFFQVGMEVRSDLLSASAFTILRLVGLSCLTPLLAFWPLAHGFAMAAPTAWLCLAVLSATGTGVTLRLLSQRSALRTPQADCWWRYRCWMTCPPSACSAWQWPVAAPPWPRAARLDHPYG